MRHRFHSICPYFAMFPETFVEKHLAASPHEGIVFDPFCGRGTTVFQALLQGRMAAGCDTNPVAVCVSKAKCDAPKESEALARVEELRGGCHEPADGGWEGELKEFFDLCFHDDTLLQIRYLRSVLAWRDSRVDRLLRRCAWVRFTASHIDLRIASVIVCPARSAPSLSTQSGGGQRRDVGRRSAMCSIYWSGWLATDTGADLHLG